MKKGLLLAAFAMLCAGSTFAWDLTTWDKDKYPANSTQMFKATGENIVVNGDFASGLDGWYGTDKETAPNVEVWSKVEGAGPNGEAVIEALGADADMPLCNSWTLESGVNYVVTMQIKLPGAGNTGISTDTNVPANCVDFFLNTDGAFKKVASTDDAPVVNVAEAAYCAAEEWTTLVFFVTPGAADKLVMHIEKLTEGTQIANIKIRAAKSVPDRRIGYKKILYAQQLMEDAHFNIAEAAAAKTQLQGTIEQMNDDMDSEDIDDDTSMWDGDLEDLATDLEAFLKVSSTSMNSKLTGLDFANLAAVGRGRGFTASTVANLNLGDTDGNGKGGNWGHVANTDFLNSGIQKGYDTGATMIAFNTTFPKGEYFFSAEIRNGKPTTSSWPYYGATFDVETTTKMFIGKDTVDVKLSGEEFTRIMMFGNIDEDGTFRAGVVWPGLTEIGSKLGGLFQIRDVQIRTMGDPEAEIARKEAWNKFIAQWNAAVGARNKVESMIGDKIYPWAQDSLLKAKAQWDPYYDAVVKAGWITEDGEDAKVATNDELTDWALYQGVEAYSEPDGEGNTKRLEYQVVRGYQAAANYVIAQNKTLSDLLIAINDAKAYRDDAMNVSGDKAPYTTAIDAAQAVYDDVLANTTDEKKEADDARIAEQMTKLAEAKTVFAATVTLKPMVAIDFSNKFELIKETSTNEQEEEVENEFYAIAGTAGRMTFPVDQVNTDNTASDNWLFQLGYNEELLDVLHVGGNGYGTVTLPEIPTENDCLRLNFDVWYGNLGKGYLNIDLLNAAGEVVAGFSMDRYNGAVAYNDFNNDANTGMDIKQATGLGSSSVGNAGICVDGNKTSFDLLIDIKANTVQGTLVNGKNVKNVGQAIAMKDIADKQIVSFRVGTTTYQKANSGAYGRRCWFDNLVIWKYESNFVGVKGDVNGDGKVNGTDIQAVINLIVEDEFQKRADINEDGKVNGTDIQAIINIIVEEE